MKTVFDLKILIFPLMVFVLSKPVAVLSASSKSNKTKAAAQASSKTNDPFGGWSGWFDDFKTSPFFSAENILRGARVLSLFFAIFFINLVLVAAFRYIVTTNDEKVAKSRQEIAIGLTGTILVFCFYFWASTVLVKMGAET